MHKPEEELKSALAEAASKVRLNGLYSHYKNPDKLYRVINLALTEADDEVCVIYEAQYGRKLVFVRPLASWLEKVEIDGTEVPRFKPV